MVYVMISVDPQYVYVRTPATSVAGINDCTEGFDPRDGEDLEIPSMEEVFFLDLGISRRFQPAEVTCMYTSGRHGTLADFPRLQREALARYRDRPTCFAHFQGTDPVWKVMIPAGWYNQTAYTLPESSTAVNPEDVIFTLATPHEFRVEFRSLAEVLQEGTGGLELREFSLSPDDAEAASFESFRRDRYAGVIFYSSGDESSLWEPIVGEPVDHVILGVDR